MIRKLMKGIMDDFLIFIVGVFVILIIIATVFGRGIAYNYLGILAASEPAYLEEDLRTFLTVASFSPGEFEARLRVDLEHEIVIYDSNYKTVNLTTPPQFNLPETQSTIFLSNCDIIKSCEKFNGTVGDSCNEPSDCLEGLDCKFGLSCQATNCSNGIIDLGEECDIGNLTKGIQPIDNDCKGLCNIDCKCSGMHKQCKDGIDNDGDGKIDIADPECHTDSDALNTNSYDPTISSEYNYVNVAPQCNDNIDNNNNGLNNIADPYCHTDHDSTDLYSYEPSRFETGQVGDFCTSDSNCYRLLKCMNKVQISKGGGTLIIKKFYENNVCKIQIKEIR